MSNSRALYVSQYIKMTSRISLSKMRMYYLPCSIARIICHARKFILRRLHYFSSTLRKKIIIDYDYQAFIYQCIFNKQIDVTPVLFMIL